MLIVFILEIVGTVAFAISGAVTAIKKEMDILGICIMGITTACGGGVFRDVILGQVPPSMFREPIYALVGIIASLVVFLIAKYKADILHSERLNVTIQIADAIGLGIFTAVGVDAVITAGYGSNSFFAVTLGVITGVGGGLLRDILAGDRPYIFVKHIYASASIVGAVLYVIIYLHFGEFMAILAGSVSTILIRILAMHFRWSLPKV